MQVLVKAIPKLLNVPKDKPEEFYQTILDGHCAPSTVENEAIVGLLKGIRDFEKPGRKRKLDFEQEDDVFTKRVQEAVRPFVDLGVFASKANREELDRSIKPLYEHGELTRFELAVMKCLMKMASHSFELVGEKISAMPRQKWVYHHPSPGTRVYVAHMGELYPAIHEGTQLVLLEGMEIDEESSLEAAKFKTRQWAKIAKGDKVKVIHESKFLLGTVLDIVGCNYEVEYGDEKTKGEFNSTLVVPVKESN